MVSYQSGLDVWPTWIRLWGSLENFEGAGISNTHKKNPVFFYVVPFIQSGMCAPLLMNVTTYWEEGKSPKCVNRFKTGGSCEVFSSNASNYNGVLF